MSKYDFDFDIYEENTLSWIARCIEPKSRVLEFGAANGRLTRYLTKEKKCLVDVVEIDQESGKEAVEYANKAYIGKEKGDIEKYQWVNSNVKYDYIVFADVLEHLFHPQEVLDQCKMVIKNEGKILVSVPNVSHNSIIIELMNDEFEYNPIGLLDNTHIRFFTRKSFTKMVEKVGWAVIGEKAKYIRVGENEIKSTYGDVSKEVYKELIKRDNGDVYQYMFTLALSSEYLIGKVERCVCLDAYSRYYVQAVFENDGIFDYRKSVSRYINPSMETVYISIDILENSKSVCLELLNCNCVLDIKKIYVEHDKECRVIQNYQSNETFRDGYFYFTHDTPKIEFDLYEADKKIKVEFNIIKYDFEDALFDELVDKMIEKELKLRECVDTYEKVIEQKDKEFKESIDTYEKVIKQKDREFKESVNTYEEVIKQKESRKTLEQMMKKRLWKK